MSQKKAIIIGVDGVQFEKLHDIQTPNIDKLNIIKSFTGGIRGTETEQQTYSGPGWGALLTGVWVNKHGIVTNDKSLRANSEYPSIFRHIHNHNPYSYIASLVNWGSIHAYFEEDIKSIVDFKLTAPEPTEDNLAQDNLIAQTVAELILNKAPDFTFVHLDNVDAVGHRAGFSQSYLESITQADAQLGIMLDAVEQRAATNPQEDWLVIVTTDHGREPDTGFAHSGQTKSERTTWIAANKKLNSSKKASATDLVPTVLDHLGIRGGNFAGTSLFA